MVFVSIFGIKQKEDITLLRKSKLYPKAGLGGRGERAIRKGGAQLRGKKGHGRKEEGVEEEGSHEQE